MCCAALCCCVLSCLLSFLFLAHCCVACWWCPQPLFFLCFLPLVALCGGPFSCVLCAVPLQLAVAPGVVCCLGACSDAVVCWLFRVVGYTVLCCAVVACPSPAVWCNVLLCCFFRPVLSSLVPCSAVVHCAVSCGVVSCWRVSRLVLCCAGLASFCLVVQRGPVQRLAVLFALCRGAVHFCVLCCVSGRCEVL